MSNSVAEPSGLTMFIYRERSQLNAANVVLTIAGQAETSGNTVLFPVSGLPLQPQTAYWFALTGDRPASSGTYRWNFGHTAAQNNGFTILAGHQTAPDGLHWDRYSGSMVFQFSVEAAPVPEPASCWILAAAAMMFGLWRRNAASSSSTVARAIGP